MVFYLLVCTCSSRFILKLPIGFPLFYQYELGGITSKILDTLY